MTPSSRRASSPNLVRAARRDEPPAVEHRLGSVQAILCSTSNEATAAHIASLLMPQR